MKQVGVLIESKFKIQINILSTEFSGFLPENAKTMHSSHTVVMVTHPNDPMAIKERKGTTFSSQHSWLRTLRINAVGRKSDLGQRTREGVWRMVVVVMQLYLALRLYEALMQYAYFVPKVGC